MISEHLQLKSILLNYTAMAQCVIALGGLEVRPREPITELCRQRAEVRCVVRQIHVVTDHQGMPAHVRDEFLQLGAFVHQAHGNKTECLTFLHATRMAELFDVVALVVDDAGYLPLVRHIKSLGAAVELHAMPSTDPALFPAADEVVGLYPPGAPLPHSTRQRVAA